MDRFHLNLATGNAVACKLKHNSCHMGSHFDSKDDATRWLSTQLALSNADDYTLLESPQKETLQSFLSLQLQALYQERSKALSAREKLFRKKGFAGYKEGLTLERKLSELETRVTELIEKYDRLSKTIEPKPQAPLRVRKNHGWFKEMSDGSYVLPLHEHCPSCGRDADEHTMGDGETWVCYH